MIKRTVHQRMIGQFQLDHALLSRVASLTELVGQWTQANRSGLVPHLRRANRVRSVQASLAIEQNTLSLEQVTALLQGKRVSGPPREIQEVRNAFAAYESLSGWNPARLQDLLAAHRLLMAGLADDAGQLRRGGVGIFNATQLVHMAPPASQLPRLMKDLFGWLTKTQIHPLLASSVFHYELEFIHPFSDGNGRIGRLWQTLILSRWQPLLAYLPVETVIKDRQLQYYQALRQADAAGDCSGFVGFLLDALTQALRHALTPEAPVKTPVKTPVKLPDQLLAMLRAQPTLTLAQAATVLGKSTRAVERAARQLREAGHLRFAGPRKGGHWETPQR